MGGSLKDKKLLADFIFNKLEKLIYAHENALLAIFMEAEDRESMMEIFENVFRRIPLDILKELVALSYKESSYILLSRAINILENRLTPLDFKNFCEKL